MPPREPKPSRKHVYRRDDRVTIVEPLVVRRVGYPLGMADALKHVEPLIQSDLFALFDKVGASIGVSGLDDLGPTIMDRDYQQALRAVAHAYLDAQSHGGRDRTIHTELCERYRGLTGRVMGKRMVKTGQWHPGYAGSGFEDDYDEPPYLDRVRTHVLLKVEVCVPNPEHTNTWGFTFPDTIELEERNVKPEEPLPYAQ